MPNSLFAQGTGGPGMLLRNCYQSITLEDGLSFNVLQGDFRFQQFGTSDPGGYIQLTPYDSFGVLPFDYELMQDDLMGWVRRTIDVIEVIDTGPLYTVETEVFDIYDPINGWFQEWFIVPAGTEWFELDFFTPIPGDSGYTRSTSLTINILDPQSSIEILDQNGDSCQTFNNYNIDYNLLLDGFCGEVFGKIMKLPGDITDPLDPYDTLDIELGIANDLINMEDHCTSCSHAAPSHPQPTHPVPCGCKEYDLEITYKPCSDMFPCPDLKFKLEEEICCRCDIRTNNNPGH